MTSYSLDAESFINEVRKHPEIWDLNSEDNRYKAKKQGAWEGVARVFIPDLDSMSEVDKIEVYRKLHGKWRNIRDAYVRNLRKKDGKRGYMYAKQLSFLSALYNNDQSQSDDDNSEESKKIEILRTRKSFETNSHMEEDTTSTIDNLKRRRTNNPPLNSIEFVDTPVSNDIGFQLEDEDRSFFDSLLPAVRELNTDQKLEFRTEVLQLLKNIRSSTTICIKQSPSYC